MISNISRIPKILLATALCWAGASAQADDTAEAIFAGGCFWCSEADFEKVVGVKSAVSGYIGGSESKPSYKQVSAGGTGHTEAVKLVYDPKVVSYEQLLKVFWHSIDPLAKDRQFCDSGSQYRSAIFYLNDQQKALAKLSKAELERGDIIRETIYTEIVAATQFWQAEKYHQDYYKKNPLRYKYYRYSCGRDGRLEEVWGDMAGWKPASKR